MKSLPELANLIENPIINFYGSLDEVFAEERFAGKSYNDAVEIFLGNETWIYEDLMWMAHSGFLFYFCACLDALDKKILDFEDPHFADRVGQLLVILNFRGREFTETSGDHEAAVRCRLAEVECTLIKSKDTDAARLIAEARKLLSGWPKSMGGGFTL